MARIINPLPIRLPKKLLSGYQPSLPNNNFCHIPGQASVIRFFDSNSIDDYHSLREIVKHKNIKNTMDDTGNLTRLDYRHWTREHSFDSFLFAVHDTRVSQKEFNNIRGFVNIYSERSEKFRIKRMIKNGFLPKSALKKHVLEISLAIKPPTTKQISGSGLMSSALRLSCLQVRAQLSYPKIKDLNLYAFINPKNYLSIRTVEASGFVKKGVMKYDSDSEHESYLYFLSWPKLSKKINSNLFKINLLTHPQITDSHCGPAVIQNLLAFNHIKVSQNDIVNTVNAQDTIIEDGLRPSQIADAVTNLAPKLQILFKQNTTAKDLKILIHDYHIPVAVNWQGLFYDTVKEEKKLSPFTDHGHYSVVINLNIQKDEITIADPYPEYCHKPRVFSYRWFKTRWWDIDKTVNPKSRRTSTLSFKKLIFIIIPKNIKLPANLQLQP